MPIHDGALYGAYVLAPRAGAVLTGLDAAAALSLPGVVRCLSAADLPAIGTALGGVRNYCDPNPRGGTALEPLFVEAGSRCEYAGQPVGLVLGTRYGITGGTA